MRIRFAGAALVAILAIAGPASSAMTHRTIGLTATVFTVDSTDDSVDAVPGDGACADSGGACTLRAATQEAAATAGSVQIAVPAGTYALSIANPAVPCCSVPAIAFDPATGDLDVAGTVSIVGAGVGQSIVSAAFLDRVVQIAAGAHVTLQGLTLERGQQFDCAGGLGIYNDGTLDLEQIDVFSNGGCGTGGGIHNAGLLTANATTVGGNTPAEVSSTPVRRPSRRRPSPATG